MLLTKSEAEALLREAESCNPGPWGNHSRTAAHCAEKIAAACGMDSEKAYIMGLLHDIGRKFGVSDLRHVYDGWKYMNSLGCEEAARACLTHSFSSHELNEYVGKFDLNEQELAELKAALRAVEFDDYDRLIRLCDAISGPKGVMDIIERMSDVKRRYGSYPAEKWDSNLALKSYFERLAGRDLYDIVEKDSFRP